MYRGYISVTYIDLIYNCQGKGYMLYTEFKYLEQKNMGKNMG